MGDQRDYREKLPPAAELRDDPRARARAAAALAAYLALPERPRPIGVQALIVLDAKEGVTDGGIVLPDMLQDQQTSATVLAVGPRCTAVRPGERVAVGKWNGQRLEDETCRRYGFEAGSLWIVQPVGDRGAPHVAADHVLGVIEEEG